MSASKGYRKLVKTLSKYQGGNGMFKLSSLKYLKSLELPFSNLDSLQASISRLGFYKDYQPLIVCQGYVVSGCSVFKAMQEVNYKGSFYMLAIQNKAEAFRMSHKIHYPAIISEYDKVKYKQMELLLK